MAETDSKPEQPAGLAKWTPTLPTISLSMLNPFSNDESNKANTDANASSHQSNKRSSILSSFLPTSLSANPPSPDKDDNSFMYAEPDTRSNSEVESREGSVAELSRRKSTRSNKPKTSYSICHPAPSSSTRQKLHRRPQSLLQLHKLCANARPQPAFEVIPSRNFSVRLTRAITTVFRAKHGLCPNDLVVLKAEKYAADEPDEEQEARDIIALICKGRKEDGAAPGKAKICLPEGRVWEAYPTLNGGYEFFSTDEHGLGLTVRWVPKKNKDGSKAKETEKKKFNFSTISPNSRRHPVIATLSKTGMDINDTYKMPDASAATPLSTPKQGSTLLADAMEEENGGQEQCETDDRLRQIIVMTGIWVTFKEGWSPNFKYEDKEKDINSAQRSPSLQYSPSKAATFSSPVSTPPASPGVAPAPLEKRNSIKGILRTGSLLSRGNRTSTTSVPEGIEEPAQAESTKMTGRTRADSASTVLVHRAASNRAKNHQATWRPDLLSSQQETQEPLNGHHPGSPSAPSADMVAPFLNAAPARRESVARPLLPSTHQSLDREESEAEGSAGAATPRATGGQPASTEKRESSTTTTTTSSADAPRKPATQASGSTKKKKRGGLRRLLCGSGHNDV